jgi:hypothetical protein
MYTSATNYEGCARTGFVTRGDRALSRCDWRRRDSSVRRNNGSLCYGVLETYAQAFGLLVWDIIEDDEEFDESHLYFEPKKDQCSFVLQG